MGMSGVCRALNYVATCLQVALACAIVGIVAAKLQDVKFQAGFGMSSSGGTAWGVQTNATCFLGTAVESSSLCTYVYFCSGVSLLISLLISLVKCITCDLCGCGAILDLVFSVAGSVWWAVGASVVTAHVKEASDADLPLQQFRTAVVAMMWGEVALFGTLLASGLAGCASRCCCGPSPRFQKLKETGA